MYVYTHTKVFTLKILVNWITIYIWIMYVFIYLRDFYIN